MLYSFLHYLFYKKKRIRSVPVADSSDSSESSDDDEEKLKSTIL